MATPVSTRRVFHTLIDAAAPTPATAAVVDEVLAEDAPNVRRLSLRHTLNGRDPEAATAFSEVYPPLNFVRAIETRQPELLTQFRCLATRRAVVRPVGAAGPLKLIHVDGVADALHDLAADPREMDDLLAQEPETVAALNMALEQMAQRVEREREAQPAGAAVDLDSDELLRQRLRGLGYLE